MPVIMLSQPRYPIRSALDSACARTDHAWDAANNLLHEGPRAGAAWEGNGMPDVGRRSDTSREHGI